eukprot:766560-Hanusia_phi.AAC.2
MRETAKKPNVALKSLLRSRSAENLLGNLRLETVQECKEENEEPAESGFMFSNHSCEEDECASGPHASMSDTSSCAHEELSTSPFLLPIESVQSNTGMRRSSSENNICYKGNLLNLTSRTCQPSPTFKDFLLQIQAEELCKKSNQLKLLHKISRTRGKQCSAKSHRVDSSGDQLRSRYLARLGITRRREMQEAVRLEDKSTRGNPTIRRIKPDQDKSRRCASSDPPPRNDNRRQTQGKQTCSQAASNSRGKSEAQQEMNYLGGWIF